MKGLLESAQIIGNFAGLVSDPEKTEKVFKIAQIGRKSSDRRHMELLGRKVRKQPELVEMYEARYFPEKKSLETLSKLPPCTLGKVYADHMIQNKLDPEFYPDYPKETIEDYFSYRAMQTHDLWHVLTGFDTSVEGEAGLQAFMVAQFDVGLGAILISAAILHKTQHDPEKLPHLFSAITKGYQMGLEASSLLGKRLEEKFSSPLKDLRKELKITPLEELGTSTLVEPESRAV